VAEFGLFLGFGAPRSGKEAAAAKVRDEGTAYLTALQTAGEIESWEYVLLRWHGGDLVGFYLLRGDPEKLGRLSMAPEFGRLVLRAGACMENVGVVDAYLDAGAVQVFNVWKEAIADLM